jgi:hypothetical protein
MVAGDEVMKWLLVPALGFAVLALPGCGGSSATLPEEAVCDAVTPLPTSRATPGVVSPQAYTQRIRSVSQDLARLRADLRGKYPENTFYRKETFRPDFIAFADKTTCEIQELLGLSAPDARFEQFQTNLDNALNDLLQHTLDGRDAVRRRNSSEYHDWFRGVDLKIQAVQALANAQTPGPIPVATPR